jgi:tight adherence protein C
MTIFLFVTGVLLVAVTARLVTRAIAVPRLALKAHLREIADYGFDSPFGADDLSAGERLKRSFRDISARVGRFTMRRFPAVKALKASELSAAGFYDVPPELVHGYRVLGAVGLPLLILLLAAAGGSLSGMVLLLVLAVGAAGGVIPSFLIRKRGASRLDDIDRQLPELIDLLTATIEAGLGFSASLSLISERFTGPLGDELRLTMKQQTLGMSIQQALGDMAERCDTQSMRSFVRTAGRGETLGVSIGPVLRELSSDQRRRRRQAAREKIQKAPVKMIFPLMFLIMPALMIVLMFPAAWSLAHNLPG